MFLKTFGNQTEKVTLLLGVHLYAICCWYTQGQGMFVSMWILPGADLNGHMDAAEIGAEVLGLPILRALARKAKWKMLLLVLRANL